MKDESIHENYKRFWIQNLSSHAKAMRGLFDLSETDYFEMANQFAHTFDALLQNEDSGMVNNFPKR